MKIDSLTPNNTILEELGSRLARVRKQQGYSQDKLAKQAGLGVATLRRIEDGKDSQLGSWLKLLKALDMSPAIETLMPESFNSPMSEALANKKSRPYPRSGSNRNKVSETKMIWGDENQ